MTSDQPQIVRTAAEIQHAHDTLVTLIVDDDMCREVMGLGPDDWLIQHTMRANADVLCWLLGHDHNTTFASNFAEVLRGLAAAGYTMIDAGGLIRREKPNEDKERPSDDR